MKRLFFALWPDQTTRQQCHKLAQSIGGPGKLVPANNLHVTLAFLGSVDAVKQAAVTRDAGTLAVQGMCLTFNRLSYWKKPAVVCLCTEQIDPAVSNLAAQLVNLSVRAGIAVDQRPYKPHVTLLRKAKALPDIEFAPICWEADGFCLVQSCSTPNGVEYRVIERWDIRP